MKNIKYTLIEILSLNITLSFLFDKSRRVAFITYKIKFNTQDIESIIMSETRKKFKKYFSVQ